MRHRGTAARAAAALLLKHAAWASPRNRKQWLQAMAREMDHIPDDASALSWALGSIFVSYLERVDNMSRSSMSLPAWLLCLEMAVCLGPLAWLFTGALAMTGHGVMPLNFGVPLILAALLGPLGLLLGLRTVLFKGSSVGSTTTIVLTLLAAWTVLEYTGQIVEGGFLSSWRDYVLMALLPPAAVAHLLQINSQRRATRAIA
jgi:hypothetical protein